MLRQLRRILDLLTTSGDLEGRMRALEKALGDVRDDLAWHDERIEKLRGRSTGGIRRNGREKTSEVAPGPTITDSPYPYGSPEWFEERRKAYGVP